MKMGWIDGQAGLAPGPSTRTRHPGHQVYPYLLRGIAVTRPNPVWSTNITYLRLARSFVYRVAIIDRSSRRVLPWRISNSRDPSFCVDCLEDALSVHGKARNKVGLPLFGVIRTHVARIPHFPVATTPADEKHTH